MISALSHLKHHLFFDQAAINPTPSILTSPHPLASAQQEQFFNRLSRRAALLAVITEVALIILGGLAVSSTFLILPQLVAFALVSVTFWAQRKLSLLPKVLPNVPTLTIAHLPTEELKKQVKNLEFELKVKAKQNQFSEKQVARLHEEIKELRKEQTKSKHHSLNLTGLLSSSHSKNTPSPSVIRVIDHVENKPLISFPTPLPSQESKQTENKPVKNPLNKDKIVHFSPTITSSKPLETTAASTTPQKILPLEHKHKPHRSLKKRLSAAIIHPHHAHAPVSLPDPLLKDSKKYSTEQ